MNLCSVCHKTFAKGEKVFKKDMCPPNQRGRLRHMRGPRIKVMCCVCNEKFEEEQAKKKRIDGILITIGGAVMIAVVALQTFWKPKPKPWS